MQWLESLRIVAPVVFTIFRYMSYGFIALLFISGIVRLALIARATDAIKRHVQSLRSVDYRRFQDSEHLMPVSLILPVVCETEGLKAQVENLLQLDFKQYELIVVVNSEHGQVWASLSQGYNLLPFHQPFKKTLAASHVRAVYRSAKDVRLVVLDVKDSNLAGALNAGVNISSYPIIAPVYTDLRLTKDALLKAVYAFVSDSACVFMGSFARIGDASVSEAGKRMPMLAQQQYLERLRILYTNRSGYQSYGLYLPLSNTFAAFLKTAVIEAGGFSRKAKAGAADLLLRIHARFYREKRTYCARLLPDAICYQLPQKTMRGACEQLREGLRDMRNTVRHNREIIKTVRGAGYTQLAERIWPLIEILGIATVVFSAVLSVVSVPFAVFYLLLGILFGAVQTSLAMLLEEYAFQRHMDTGLLLGRYVMSILAQIGYHLRMALVRIFS
ncbi:MAG: hypothetical protein C0413_02495 [Clostridiales bacterium]|nr:hypothetical protein [Clostridiales bacterium]